MDNRELDRDERRRRRKRERERQIRRQKLIIFWTAAAVLAVGIAAGVTGAVKSRRAAQAAREQAAQQQRQMEQEQLQKEQEENTIHLLAVGDNLIHEHIYQSGQSEWNYDHLYEHVRDLVSAADLSVVNQECIFVEDHGVISAYPSFGYRVSIGSALFGAAFVVV